jgi:hypothetical protein
VVVVVVVVLLVDPVTPVDGLVVVVELVEPVVPPEPVASFLLQALSERAATTARVATAHWVKDVFIRKLLEGLLVLGSARGDVDALRRL